MSGRLAPWLAVDLPEAAKDEKFRLTLNQRAESVLTARSSILAGWIMGAIGVACLIGSYVLWAIFLPAARTEDRLWLADQNTGIIIRPTSLDDAAKSMPEASDRHYIEQYVELCRGWVPELDHSNDYKCKLMSRPDQQERQQEWRKSANSPIATVGKAGHIEFDNFRFHREPGGDPTGTRTYRVQFTRIAWKADRLESTQEWSGVIDFQWHPELPMTDGDRTLNPGGFQAISFTDHPDTPSSKRQ